MNFKFNVNLNVKISLNLQQINNKKFNYNIDFTKRTGRLYFLTLIKFVIQ